MLFYCSYYNIIRVRRKLLNLQELIKKARSYRRFFENEKVDEKILKYAIGNVRFSPSPANKQPLKFKIINDQTRNEKIFPHLTWAAYLKDWKGPKKGERPAAYIVILGDPSKSNFISWDYGISLLTIILSLKEKGFGACAVAACDREKLRGILSIDNRYDIAAVIAVGKAREKVIIEDVIDDDIKYYRDDQGYHHVPKRSVNDLIY
jgi:nitroreductase